QAGNLLGTASVPVEITDYEVDAAPEGRAGQPLHSDPGTPPADRILFVRYERLHEQPRLIFTLQEAGAVGSEFQPVPIRGDLEQFVRELYGVPDTLRSHASRALISRDEADRQLRAIGRSLWRDVIPADLREHYARQREQWRSSTLMVVSDEPYIPWELVWPYGEPGSGWQDEDPWCVTLSLTRWLRRTAQGRGNAGPPGRLSLHALASLAPTDSGLPSAQTERDMLRTLATGHNLRDLGPDQATWSAAIDLLEEGGYDWLHVAAHGQFYDGPADSASVLRLQDRRELTPQHLAGPEIEGHIFRQHPGFFFNACHSGREGWALTHLGGWADTLISSGAGLFIAPQWQVTDSLALVFATTFYEQLLAGRTVAEAVLRARLAARTSGDPTWLAYSVYAHPNARLLE
ncbi:MAG: CHAT domain-containing protein, partial [Anaerolineae bacterium]|nr:CHAT domain-containing protein [Anaerolineae bacterium]